MRTTGRLSRRGLLPVASGLALATMLAVPATAAALEGKLLAPDGNANDFLGDSVAIAGDTIVASAIFDDVGTNADQGSAYT